QRSGGRRERQRHRGGRTGNTGDRGGTAVLDHAARGGGRGAGDTVRVHHADPYARLVGDGLDGATLDRERADAGQGVAAVLPVADRGLVDAELEEQVVDVGLGAADGLTTATLLVSEVAPPRPSICRGSGLPISRSRRSSRSPGSPGRSAASKYSPREVPPR